MIAYAFCGGVSMKQALLIIDVQKDYFVGGRCELYHCNEALEAIKEVLVYFREHKLPVFFVQHITPKGATFFEVGTKGVEIHEAIEPQEDEVVIVKHTPNSFYQTDLHIQLKAKGVDQLLICGMMTHMCIDTSVRFANDLGYTNILLTDGCATKDLVWEQRILPATVVHEVYMASLNQKFATLTQSKKWLCSLKS